MEGTVRKSKYELLYLNPDFLNKKLFTIRELTIFGMSEDTLYDLAKQGLLAPFVEIGNSKKYRYEELFNALKAFNEKKNPIKHKPKPKTKSTEEEILARITAKFITNKN